MRKERLSLIVIFLVVLGGYAYFIHFIGLESWNVSSRMDLTYSLAESASFRIDSYHQNTGDKVYYQGHYYTDKAPLPSLLAVPIFLLLKPIGVSTEKYMRYGITLLALGVPSALAALVFYRITGILGRFREEVRLTVTLAYALGTLAFPFSTVFYGHQLAAAGGIFSFYILLKIGTGGREERALPLAAAGVITGAAFLCDFTAGILMVWLSVYAWLKLRRKTKVIFWLLGMALPVGFLLYYNRVCFGGFFTSSYSLQQTYSHQAGFLGVTAPRLKALWGITFSSFRGIFYQSPFLLLAIPAFYLFYRQGRRRAEWWLCLLVVLSYLAFNAGYAYWDGVGSVGARFLIPALPFLVLPLAALKKDWFKALQVLVLVSVVFMLVVTATEPRAEWKVSSPLFYFSFFLFLHQHLSDSLGGLIGFKGAAAVIPLLAWWAGLLLLRRHYLPAAERVPGSTARWRNAFGLTGLALLWIVLAGWEEPFLREYDQGESLFRYYRGRGRINWPEVERHYYRAIKLKPDFMDPYLRLAEIARIRGRPLVARAYYDDLLKKDPRSVVIRRKKAVLEESLGRKKEAESLLREAVRLDPSNAGIHNQLADYYLRQGRRKEAAAEWEKSLKIEPRDKRVRLKLEALQGRGH